jgi:hypothetical protein
LNMLTFGRRICTYLTKQFPDCFIVGFLWEVGDV